MNLDCTGEFSAKPAARRYRREFGLGMAVYVVTLLGGVYALKHFALPAWSAIVLALVPVAPVLYAMRAYITFIDAADELQRRIQHHAILIAAAIVCMASFTYGLLQEVADFPPVSLIWVFPAMCGVWGVAAAFVAKRYR